MAEHDESERDELIAIVRAMVARLPVDWTQVESSKDDSLRATVRELKIIDEITQLHRVLHSTQSPSSPTSSDALPKTLSSVASESLTETPSGVGNWGSFTLLEQVGRGSFGEVYRALDSRLDREVALKLLHQRDGTTDAIGSAVVEEGRLLARVRHPNVVTVHGADRIDGRVGVWMEFVHGRTLEQALRQQGPFPPADVAAMGVEICLALAAVHEAGLLHRDVKAQNVVQQEDGRLVLMDLGAGRELVDDGTATDLAGTPLYLAPEVFEGRPATVQSDLYGVGVLLYHLLTGAYPVAAPTVREIRAAHCTGERVSLVDVAEDGGGPLAPVMNRALAVNPEARYRNAKEMAAALLAVGRVAPLTLRWLRPQSIAILLAILVVLVAGVIGVVKKRNRYTPLTRVSQSHSSGASAVDDNPQSQFPVTQPSTNASQPAERSQPRQPALQFAAGDWILIAAFENLTREALFDGTLEFALERELSNSAFVNVAPRERVEDVLALMQQPIDTTVDARLGREIAARDGGIRAMVTGRVEKTGGSYVITAQIVSLKDGVVAASLSEQASTRAELLPAVRRQAFRVREVLGDMPATIRQSQIALEKVTTPSIHALQLYFQAASLMRGDRLWRHEPAEQLLKQAISEDPEFASAHMLLAWAIHNQQRPEQEFLPHASRAVELADQATGPERHFIVGSYHSLQARSLTLGEDADAEGRKAIAAYKALVRVNPAHPWGLGNLGGEYIRLGLWREAAEAMSQSAEVRPASFRLRFDAVQALLFGGDSRRARLHLGRTDTFLGSTGFTQRPEWVRIQLLTAKAAWLERDGARARQALDEAVRRASGAWLDDATLQTTRYSFVYGYVDLGRFADAHRVAQESPPGLRELQMQLVNGARAIFTNQPDRDSAREFLSKRLTTLDSANASAGTPAGLGYLGIPYYLDSLIQAGLLDEVRRVVASLGANGGWGPPSNSLDIEGHVALADGRIDEGIRLLQAARQADPPKPRDLAMVLSIAHHWVPRGQVEEAISMLEDATRNGWPECVTYNAPPGCIVVWTRSRDLLAELYWQTGRVKEAESIDAELQRVLAVADVDHPVLVRIKARRGRTWDKQRFGDGVRMR
jgi:serine/threonine-protein kinase